METIARSLKKLSAGLDDHVKLVFVTTDPARDSPRALRSWLDHFDRRFVGLTGTEAAIEAAQVAAGVPPARKVRRAGEPDAVGHANFVLAYTTDNLAHVIYPGGLTQEDWAHDLPQLVRETWSRR
jgi:protein SCO1/2